MTNLPSRTIVPIVVLGMCLFVFCGCERPQEETKSQQKPQQTQAQRTAPQASIIPADPKKGQDFTVDLGSSITLEMIWISDGEFMIGSPDSEVGRKDNEGPQTQVKVNGFWMGKYEVTQEQYQQITGVNRSHFKGPKNPVEVVSLYDAMAYCTKLREKTGKQFTLPTEAQWEYACRAGTQTRYSFGDSEDSSGEYAWYCENSGRTTHPVGEKKPNQFGLCDMYGNVWEWCLSKYQEYPYSDSDGRNNLQANGESETRIIRGGSWGLLGPRVYRSAYRDDHIPDRANFFIGFRVVCLSNSR